MYFDVFFLELLKMRTLFYSFVFHFKVRFIGNFTQFNDLKCSTKPKQIALHCIFEIFKAFILKSLKIFWEIK